MAKSRGEQRYMCSDLVTARWTTVLGRRRREEVVNLEEIWPSGAVLSFSGPLRPETEVEFAGGDACFRGRVKSCAADFVGYLVEIRFEPGSEWSRERYEPEHLFDPASLLPREALKAKNDRLIGEGARSARRATA
jgi:hypothetical protein